jgi:uncharacterized cofD-like protein
MKSKKKFSHLRLPEGLARFLHWFTPGIGVKRWLLTILAGITLLGMGLAVLVLDFYRTAPETWWLPALSWASLRFLPRILRAIIFGGLGLGLIGFGIWELNRSILAPFIRPGDRLIDSLRSHRQRERGPRIVAIGGGHGLATLLRGLKTHSHNITAIVSVADDGGSSGQLRKELGILPPGDIRNCLAALSNDEQLLSQLFQYRFPDGDTLDGHSFGNLFISAMSEITGSFEAAVSESGRVLGVQGRVLPSTIHDVRLSADVTLPHTITEVRIEGESQIPKTKGRVRRIWLEPHDPPAFPESIRAILSADLIIIGPGSLYTSIIPNLLVHDIVEAIRASRALKLFICNLATQPGETDHFTCGDHLHALEEHSSGGLIDIAVVNFNHTGKLPSDVDWVTLETDLVEDYAIYQADLLDALHPWRHDAQKLAQTVMDLFQEKTGPLVE